MPEGILDVTVLRATGLRDSQLIGRQDPYFIIQVGTQHFVSKPATDGGKNPNWNQRFTFNVTDERKVFFTIKNKNVVATDDVLGTAETPLETAFTTGKHDARIQVVTTDGRVKGELSVIILFTGKQAKKKHEAATMPSHYPQGTPAGAPGAYHAPNPYAPVPGAYGAPAQPMPAAPPLMPHASHVQQPAGYPAAGGYAAPAPVPNAYPPTSSIYPPAGNAYPPPGGNPYQSGGYPPAAGGYPTQPSAPYGAPPQARPGFPSIGGGMDYPPPGGAPSGYPPNAGPPQSGYPSGYPNQYGQGGTLM